MVVSLAWMMLGLLFGFVFCSPCGRSEVTCFGFFFFKHKAVRFPLAFYKQGYFSVVFLWNTISSCPDTLIPTYSIHRKLKSQKGITANLSWYFSSQCYGVGLLISKCSPVNALRKATGTQVIRLFPQLWVTCEVQHQVKITVDLLTKASRANCYRWELHASRCVCLQALVSISLWHCAIVM